MSFTAGQKVRASDLNNITPGIEQGEWTILANLALGTPTLINNWTPWVGTNPAIIAGISHSSGVFTVTLGGIYMCAVSARGSTATADMYAFIAGASASDVWYKDSQSGAANVAASGPKRIAAGGTVRFYIYAGSAKNAIHESGTDMVTSCSIYRLGP